MFTSEFKNDILKTIAMHEFRKQTGRGQRQAVDGFLNAASRPQIGAQPPSGQRPRLDGLRTTNRQVSDFRRPEGLHPVQPMGGRAVRPLGSAESIKQAQPTPAQNQASLLHMSLPSGGMLGGTTKKDRKQAKKDRAKKRGKWHSFRRWSLRGSLVALALALVVGGFLGIKTMRQLHKVLKGGGTAAALQANVKPQLLKGEGDGRINFLLLGRGGDGHDGPDLTDTILVASIDPVNKTAAMVSIPRDLWVTVPGYGGMKVNAAYANAKYHSLNIAPKDEAKAENEGIQKAADEATAVLGIPIHYHVLMDFQAFKEAVDAVGGVDVNVPEDLVDSTMAWENGWNATLARKGVDHMAGVQALMYVRSRHGSTRGDFDRTERQRLLIESLSQRVLSAGTYTNPLKISQLLSAFGNHVTTDLSVNDSLRLMTLLKGVKGGAIQSVGLADPPNNYVHTGAVGTASVVLPTAGQDNYTDIQNYIRNTLKDPYLAKENATVAVLNGTATPGLAGTTGDKLKGYGYNVTKVDSTPTSDYKKTIIVDLTLGKKPYTKNYLQKRFGVTAVTKLPDATIQAPDADFVVILGQDASAHSQN
jgi:LCP family protein required for cell wall assembly